MFLTKQAETCYCGARIPAVARSIAVGLLGKEPRLQLLASRSSGPTVLMTAAFRLPNAAGSRYPRRRDSAGVDAGMVRGLRLIGADGFGVQRREAWDPQGLVAQERGTARSGDRSGDGPCRRGACGGAPERRVDPG